MKIYRDLSADIVKGAVATMGIFDGVHRAHQEIIERVQTLAKDKKTQSILITLWPHPRYVLGKDSIELKLLSTLDEKIIQLEKAGIDNLLLIPFDKQFASMSFDKFIQRILVDRLNIQHLVVGFNHQFGRDREGNFDNLKAFANKMGFSLEQMPKVEIEGERVSSSLIRNCVLNGNIELANKLLGYEFNITGKVVHGKKVGRQLGFPTANIELPDLYKILPPQGVYAIAVNIDGKKYDGMLNIGTRPTVDDKGLQIIEANFFDFHGDLYGQELNIKFFKRIREEKKFSSLDVLKDQILQDKQEIRKFFTK